MPGNILIAFSGDFLSSLGFGAVGGVTKGAELALNKVLKSRAETARNILMEEIRSGRSLVQEVGEDEAAAVTFRYMRAGIEGAARRNLRLLASVAAGQAADKGLYADDFLKWADTLAGIGRSELVVLGVVQRLAQPTSFKVSEAGPFWMEVLQVLKEDYKVGADEADASASACLRTGLLQLVSGLWDMGHAYVPSPSFKEISQLTNFEVVLRKEGDI